MSITWFTDSHWSNYPASQNQPCNHEQWFVAAVDPSHSLRTWERKIYNSIDCAITFCFRAGSALNPVSKSLLIAHCVICGQFICVPFIFFQHFNCKMCLVWISCHRLLWHHLTVIHTLSGPQNQNALLNRFGIVHDHLLKSLKGDWHWQYNKNWRHLYLNCLRYFPVQYCSWCQWCGRHNFQCSFGDRWHDEQLFLPVQYVLCHL